MKRLVVTEEVWKEGAMYVSHCPELDVASCGTTVEEAKKNLQEAIAIQLEETKKLGTLDEFLEGAGFSLKESSDLLTSSKHRLVREEITIPLAA